MAIKHITTPEPDFQALRKTLIFDEHSNALPFSRLFDGKLISQIGKDEKRTERVLVIFIRHFFCGLCQEYLRRLAEHQAFSECMLAKFNTRVVVIGCGAPSLIGSYRSGIELPTAWSMYADPTLKLYNALSMNRSYSLGDHPDYIQQSTFRNMMASVAQAIRRVSEGDVFSAGDWNVQGGEFLFESDPFINQHWNIVWRHRMAHSRDHTEVDKLASTLTMSATNLQTVPESRTTSHTRTASTAIPQRGHGEPDCGTHAISLRTTSLRRYVSARRHSRPSVSVGGC